MPSKVIDGNEHVIVSLNPSASKDQYLQALLDLLTAKELKVFNERLYFNPDHIDFWLMYHRGHYAQCLQYVQDHRSVLS